MNITYITNSPTSSVHFKEFARTKTLCGKNTTKGNWTVVKSPTKLCTVCKKIVDDREIDGQT